MGGCWGLQAQTSTSPKRRGVGTRKGPEGRSKALPRTAARPCPAVDTRTGEIHEASGGEGSPAGARTAWLGVSLRRQAGSRCRAEEVEVCGGKEV